MATMSPDEVEREHREKLGDDFGGVYYALYTEVAWLHVKWREYCALYGTSPERIELLNRAAPRFFSNLDGMLWEDVLLHICRITDRPSIGRYRQLTIRRLPGYVRDASVKAEIESLVEAAVQACAFARDWRDVHISHRSLKRALDESSRPLAHASRLSVNGALAALDAVIERVHERFLGGARSLDVEGEAGDALDLLRVLVEGVDAIEAREQRFRDGTMTLHDLAPRRAV